jgi:hypothetical protein
LQNVIICEDSAIPLGEISLGLYEQQAITGTSCHSDGFQRTNRQITLVAIRITRFNNKNFTVLST